MGDYTANVIFYKPGLGAAGAAEKLKFDTALDTADTMITAVVATASTALSIAVTGSTVGGVALTTATAASALAAVATSNAATALTTATAAYALAILVAVGVDNEVVMVDNEITFI